MSYQVVITPQALKQLKKMDRYTQQMLIHWIDKYLTGCTNPRYIGKALVGNLKNQWRYRVGDYRLLCDIVDNQLIILVINMGHRKDVYQ